VKILLVSTSRSDINFLSQIFKTLQQTSIPVYLLLTGQHSFSGIDSNTPFLSQFSSAERGNIITSDILGNTNYSYSNDASSTADETFLTIKKLKPTCVILSGDRYEMLVAATVCSQLTDLKLIHYAAGQTSTGSQDEIYRECISRLCQYYIFSNSTNHLKLASTLPIEDSQFCITGSLGLDRLYQSLPVAPVVPGKVLLIMHPQAYHNNELIDFTVHTLLLTRQELGSSFHLFISRVNNDLVSDSFYSRLVSKIRDAQIQYNELLSIPDSEYIYHLGSSCVLLGNSSSLVVEAPSLTKSTILLGDRQAGRESARSVLKANLSVSRFNRLLRVCLSLNDRPSSPAYFVNPYYLGGGSTILQRFLRRIHD